jgi:aminopeptidase N
MGPEKVLDGLYGPRLCSDFGPGAMENWGLITYKEDSILIEEGELSNR